MGQEWIHWQCWHNNGSWAVNPHCNPSSHCGRYRYLDGRGQHLVKFIINSVPLSTLTVLQVILHPLQGPLLLHAAAGEEAYSLRGI